MKPKIIDKVDYMVVFKKADLNDSALIHTMASEVFPATYSELLTSDQMDYMMEWMYSLDSLRQQMEQGCVYYIAYREDEPCGYISVQYKGDRVFCLHKIYVLPLFQGFGIGKILFEKAILHIREQNLIPCTMELCVNRQNIAVQFYERLGMHIVQEKDSHIGQGYYMNDYIMAMDILHVIV